MAHRHEWFRTGAMEPGQMRCIECGEWGRRIPAPTRRPLTDEAIWRQYQALWPFHPADEPRLAEDIVKFARAIERAHKIGGNDD